MKEWKDVTCPDSPGNILLSKMVTKVIANTSSSDAAPRIIVVIPFFFPYFLLFKSIMPGTTTAGLTAAII